MQREIGSNFWLDPAVPLTWEGDIDLPLTAEAAGERAFLSTGRAAIALALETLLARRPAQPRVALVPAFTCYTVLDPFLDRGFALHALPMDCALCTAGQSLVDAAEAYGATVVLVHRYFGFDTLPDGPAALQALRERGIALIDDCTQSLYSALPPLPAELYVGSLRKWAGLPDGAFTACRAGALAQRPGGPDLRLEQAKLAASHAKYRYLFEGLGEKPAYLQLYREAEELLSRQTGFATMAPASRAVQAGLDIPALSAIRRDNYQTLLEGLDGISHVRPIFPALPEGITPLYLPLLVEGDREGLQAHLAAGDIYAPVIWPRPEQLPPVCSAAETVYRQILCLPVDQRYGRDDMARLAERIRSAG